MTTLGKTAVDMEGLTAVVLPHERRTTCVRPVGPELRVEAVRLVRKMGGRSGTLEAE